MTDRSVIDPESGINACRNILRIYRSFLGPSWLLYIGPIRSRPSDHAASADSAAGYQCRMDEVVVASLLAGNITYRSPELTFDDDQCFIQFGFSIRTWNHSEIFDKAGQTRIQLPRRSVNAGIGRINIL